jgi:hypothetical protein
VAWQAEPAGVDGKVTTANPAAPVKGGPDPRLFARYRRSLSTVPVPVANGFYDVTLWFAEQEGLKPGQRTFDVSLEGRKVADDLDVVATAGPRAAYALRAATRIADGRLDVLFSNRHGGSELAGIEVVPRSDWPDTIHVDAGATGPGHGTASAPFRTINDALAVAGPGDIVDVAAGTYPAGVATVRSGVRGANIVIRGRTGARIVGKGTGRAVNLHHSFVTLQNFDIAKADIGIWAQQVTGVLITGNRVHDMAGECIRMKYQSVANEIANNVIGKCGLTGFDVAAGRKNGEGIYLGTAPEQLDRNPTAVPDRTADNVVRDNDIVAPAECVDMKEATHDNRVENNRCSGGRDPESGGVSSRGRANVIRDNQISDEVGAGVRLGGDTATDGIDTTVVGNTFSAIKGYAVKVMRDPQRQVCGNTFGPSVATPGNGGRDPRKPC